MHSHVNHVRALPRLTWDVGSSPGATLAAATSCHNGARDFDSTWLLARTVSTKATSRTNRAGAGLAPSPRVCPDRDIPVSLTFTIGFYASERNKWLYVFHQFQPCLIDQTFLDL